MRVYFYEEDDQIILTARMEGDDGTIGDFSDSLGPEEELFGLTYEELQAAAPGSFDVDEDGKGTIVPDDREA